MFISGVVSFVEVFLFVLISVAFLTLLERKVLSYTQIRKGPNKLGIAGVLQPFSDAIKLFSKEDSFPRLSNVLLFWISPFFGFLLAMLVWSCLPLTWGLVDMQFGILFFLCCVGLSVYSIIFSGWSSNSKYALLGGLRSVAQTISYEIVMAFILLCLMFAAKSLSLKKVLSLQEEFCFFFLLPSVFVIFFVSCVVETNRAPFDLAEGESELVSGFNVEYGGLKFALIFMAEYAMIIWMSMLCSILFCGQGFLVSSFLLIVVFLFLRSSYPRIRYDFLMDTTWKKFLPVVLLLYFWAWVLW
uniref:NADH-ubiquinone oxidoreductase chain 1 n=1 Tax=Hypsibius dujardini TaxID=232323 RepID=E7BBB5_HYPDU|nr:NADH dehydrogenase subunit 1 [Hypsibius dujardini]CBY83896.1 NADH dehydogenase subunit 1 [Hypsibius dujardini]